MFFLYDLKSTIMANKNEKGHDPERKDDSSIQPGVQTVSNHENDPSNQQLTETTRDGFREDVKKDRNADPKFDDVDKE